MKGEIRSSLTAVATAVMLVACASKGSVPAKSADTSAAQDETSSEYQRLAENASQRRICKRQAVLGTRVDSVVCVTEAEMKAQREQAADVMRDIQANTPMNRPDPVPPPSPPPRQ